MIWDLPTRITHWALALCVILNLFFLEEGDPPHQWLGYTAVALVVFRFLWGFFGAEHSRFRSFPIAPRSLYAFVKNGFHWENSPGHNPLASLVYIGIWILILSLGTTGFMMGLDRYWGEEWLEDLHGRISTALEILILVHLIGLAHDSFRYKRKTWMRMISGRR